MKATLEFNLPEEAEDYDAAVAGPAYLSILQDLDNFLRSQLKHNDELSDDERRAYDKVRSDIYERVDPVSGRLTD